jgi:long-chain acyl-CoA synthetase
VFTGGDELPLALQRNFIDLAGKPIQVGGDDGGIWLTIARTPSQRRGFGKAGERCACGSSATTGACRARSVSSGSRSDGVARLLVSPRGQTAKSSTGWLRSGDMGLCDEKGDYRFTAARRS